MACIFMDGFDYYQGSGATTLLYGDLGKRWTSNGGATLTVGPAYARTSGGQGVKGSTGGGAAALLKTFGANYTQGCIGMALYVPAGQGTASRQFFAVFDGATEQISVRTNASSVLIVTRNGTLLATGSTVVATGIWDYIELKFTIHASAGVVELHLNGGTEIASTASLNTRNTANTQWNGVAIIAYSAQDYWADDVYVLDTSTGSNTTFLGPVQVVARSMVAAGNKSQWTPNGGTNMGCVSDLNEDGDNSFNMSATANQIDSFEVQDLPAATGSVLAVQPVIVARQDAGAARTIAPLLRIGGADYVGATQALSTSYQFLQQIYDLEPVGGTPAWSIADFNATEAGYKLIS
jgi:hypothetical protein